MPGLILELDMPCSIGTHGTHVFFVVVVFEGKQRSGSREKGQGL